MRVNINVALLLAVVCLGASAAEPQQSSVASASDTIRQLDKDGNGLVNLSEIEDFARKSGMDAAEIRSDFHELDTNADGELDAQEIGGLLSATAGEPQAQVVPASAAAVQIAPVQTLGAGPMPAVLAQPEGFSPAQTPVVAPVPAEVQQPQAFSAAVAGTELKEAAPSIEALGLDAERQAGGILAAGLAKRAEAMIRQGEKDEKDSNKFEATARSLRGSASASTKSLASEARRVAHAAVDAAAKPGLTKAQRLKHQAEDLEKGAQEHRLKAKQALQRATQAQFSAGGA